MVNELWQRTVVTSSVSLFFVVDVHDADALAVAAESIAIPVKCRAQTVKAIDQDSKPCHQYFMSGQ